MSDPVDPVIEASERGWIAEHRSQYLKDGEAAHLWDSTVAGGPGPVPTLLLFTTGRKSGKDSIMPLIYGKVDDGYAIIASKGGTPTHPGWFHNLRAQGTVKISARRFLELAVGQRIGVLREFQSTLCRSNNGL